jgi:hypothetical protein
VEIFQKMGNLISTVSPVRANIAGIQSFVSEIHDISYEKRLLLLIEVLVALAF